MCGGGGNYGQVAEGIGGMFAGGQQPGVGSVPAPTQSADTTSGIGQYMPMQQATNLYAPTQGMQPGQQFTPEQLYDPMAAAQARLASIPERQVMSPADLVPNTPVEEMQPDMSNYLSREEFDSLRNNYNYQGMNQLGVYNPMMDKRP